MKLEYTERFIKSLESAPPSIQKAFYKQGGLLMNDLRHPSLRAKKYDEARDIWQALGDTGLALLFQDSRRYVFSDLPHGPSEVAKKKGCSRK